MTHGYYSHCCVPATASPRCRPTEWWSRLAKSRFGGGRGVDCQSAASRLHIGLGEERYRSHETRTDRCAPGLPSEPEHDWAIEGAPGAQLGLVDTLGLMNRWPAQPHFAKMTR
jgi:hypothetical protein